MYSIEIGQREPGEENPQEKEQTPEEILEVIKEAIEKGEEVSLTQLTADGKITKDTALPISVEGNYLTIEADGYGFSIEIDGIKRAE